MYIGTFSYGVYRYVYLYKCVVMAYKDMCSYGIQGMRVHFGKGVELVVLWLVY